MKYILREEERHRLWINLVVVIGGIACFFIFLHLDTIFDAFHTVGVILRPFLYGFIIAFLLNTPVKFFERALAPLIRPRKLLRAVAVILTILIFTAVVAALVAFLMPQLVDSALTLVRNIQDFIRNMDQYVNAWLAFLERQYHMETPIYENLRSIWERILSSGTTLLLTIFQRLLGLTGQITSSVIDFFVAMIISIYFLMSREYFFALLRKLLYALFPKKTVGQLLYVGRLTNSTFNGFINGKLLDSLIIGILAFICLTVMKMPYALLISVIVGVTNIIPFFGPFVGAIPSAFIIFIVNPIQAVWFLIFILILQQIDGNIIGPRILGNSTGLPAIWVIFAILVGGGIAGFLGMLIGVPTMAVLYSLARSYIRQRLEHRSLPVETSYYKEPGADPYQSQKGENTDATTGQTETDA